MFPHGQPPDLLEALDPEQRRVAEALRGPVRVLAGAGTDDGAVAAAECVEVYVLYLAPSSCSRSQPKRPRLRRPRSSPPRSPRRQEPVPASPSFRQRGRLRRRLRYLRRVRELGFRDLGGLVFDQHRFSQVDEGLVRGKLAALGAVDAELRALEIALDDRRSLTELREPGISVCSR